MVEHPKQALVLRGDEAALRRLALYAVQQIQAHSIHSIHSIPNSTPNLCIYER